MEPDQQPVVDQASPPVMGVSQAEPPKITCTYGPPQRDAYWVLFGPHGLRVGWSILLFATLYYIFRFVVGTAFYILGLVGDTNDFSAGTVLVGEMIPLLGLVGAALVMALVESRRISDYNLAGPHRARNFFSGFVTGFIALSLLVGALAWGGWLRFDGAVPAVPRLAQFAALWACAFLAVAMLEEGLFRCYSLSTLARGINFWWALAAQAAVCLYLALDGRGQGAWGVYLAAALGFFPCLALHLKAAPRSGGSGGGAAFWQAAWVTSTVFAFYHTSNNGENWVGIFAAAFIGFVFCVSVRLTGSALWAIGCHAAWDWAETFFYGTADSGLQMPGHLLSSNPAGNPLWSGGDDGPEGSLLVLAVILLLLLAVILLYRQRSSLAAMNGPGSGTASVHSRAYSVTE